MMGLMTILDDLVSCHRSKTNQVITYKYRYRSFLPSSGNDSLNDCCGGEWEGIMYDSIQHVTSMKNRQGILR